MIGCAEIDAASTTPGGPIAVATSHIAVCRVDASLGAIAVGDRLMASPESGVAMRAGTAASASTVIGRAVEPLTSGSALVRVLLGAR